jgi:hypothetical protein
MAIQRRLLTRLAAGVTLALGTGAADGALAALPEEVLAEWVEAELENEPETPLRAVSKADRAAARAQAIVTSFWMRQKEDGEALLRELARNRSGAVRIGAAAALGKIIELASPIERIELVCRWTVSDDTFERTAIARALGLPTPVFVADLAIAELAKDPVAEVRAAVIRAVKNHYSEDEPVFDRVAGELTRDPELSVRRAAAELLRAQTH